MKLPSGKLQCSCLEDFTKGLPCAHILAGLRHRKLSTFNPEYFLCRWRRDHEVFDMQIQTPQGKKSGDLGVQPISLSFGESDDMIVDGEGGDKLNLQAPVTSAVNRVQVCNGGARMGGPRGRYNGLNSLGQTVANKFHGDQAHYELAYSVLTYLNEALESGRPVHEIRRHIASATTTVFPTAAAVIRTGLTMNSRIDVEPLRTNCNASAIEVASGLDAIDMDSTTSVTKNQNDMGQQGVLRQPDRQSRLSIMVRPPIQLPRHGRLGSRVRPAHEKGKCKICHGMGHTQVTCPIIRELGERVTAGRLPSAVEGLPEVAHATSSSIPKTFNIPTEARCGVLVGAVRDVDQTVLVEFKTSTGQGCGDGQGGTLVPRAILEKWWSGGKVRAVVVPRSTGTTKGSEEVEVSGVGKDWAHSWALAVVVEKTSGEECTVEYVHFVDESTGKALMESVRRGRVRPRVPANVGVVREFKAGLEVDVYDKDVWWEARIERVDETERVCTVQLRGCGQREEQASFATIRAGLKYSVRGQPWRPRK